MMAAARSELPTASPPEPREREESALDDPHVILVVAPSGRDARLTQSLLAGAGIAAVTCANIAEVCARMESSAGALIDERTLDGSALGELRQALSHQAEWSDYPLVVFGISARTDPRDAMGEMVKLGNITFLDRPVQVRAMIFAVQAVIRARTRQYEARRAIELRERFLAMLGHELRNPLAAIRMAVESMRDGVGNAERQQVIIDRQSANLARLVDDLLDVARVTHGKVTIERARVDLVEIVRACFAACRPAAERQDHGYTLVGASASRWIDGDRLRLEQVFHNLLTNAIKYTPRGGSITVRIAELHGRVEVRVTDTGVGIAPETLPHVFELFAQSDRSLDRADGGLGLGLTVVQELVGLHGGSVVARSAGLGRGSDFVVTLPAAPSAAELPTPPATAGRSRPRRVVVVDDNDDLREMMGLLLTAHGHAVETAMDGPSGVAKILDRVPEVAFVDIGLPGFDGFEVARRVRAERKDVRLVAVSGYGQPEDRERAMSAGFDEHLKKPVGLDELDAVLRSLPSD